MQFNVTPHFLASINKFFLISLVERIAASVAKESIKKGKMRKELVKKKLSSAQRIRSPTLWATFRVLCNREVRCIARQSAVVNLEFSLSASLSDGLETSAPCIRIYRKPISGD